MADTKDIVKLALDAHEGNVAGNFSKNDTMEVLRQALVDANNGSTKLDYKAMRDGKCVGLFAIIEEILQKTVVEGLTGDEFFFQMVDYRNLALGDQAEFVVPDNSLLVVSDVASGTQGIRRQRLNGATTTKITTQPKAIKIYEELDRVLSGRIDFNEFIDRVGKSFANQSKADIYTAFSGAFSALPATFAKTGTYTEDTLLDLIGHVEAVTGENAIITGTKKALRKVTQANVSASIVAADDMYGLGFYGKFNGTPMVAMKQVHNTGTYDFALSDNDLYVIAGNSKPIKYVTEGDATLFMGDPMSNQMMAQEFTYIDKYGVGVVLSQMYGTYRLS